MKRSIALFAALFGLAACGGGDEDAGSTPAETNAAGEVVEDSAPAGERNAASSQRGSSASASSPPLPGSDFPPPPPANLRLEHGLWGGGLAFNIGLSTGRTETRDQTVVWTDEGAIWALDAPGDECRALFDDVVEDGRLRYVADDCSFETAGERFTLEQTSSGVLTGRVFFEEGRAREVRFGKRIHATSPRAKVPEGVSMDILGISLTDMFAELEEAALDAEQLAAGRTNEINLQRPMLEPIQLGARFSSDIDDERPLARFFRFDFKSSNAGFPNEYVQVYTVGGRGPDALPFYIVRRSTQGMTEPERTFPPSERVREALEAKFGEPSSVGALGSRVTLSWFYDVNGQQVNSSECGGISGAQLPTLSNIATEHRPKIAVGCGYRFIADMPRSGEARGQGYSILDASRIAGPLTYQEFIANTQPVGPQRDEIIAVYAETLKAIEAVQNTEVEL